MIGFYVDSIEKKDLFCPDSFASFALRAFFIVWKHQNHKSKLRKIGQESFHILNNFSQVMAGVRCWA